MCDLIDLNSPDRKGSLSSRLASPLIPVPIDAVCSNYNSRTTDPRSLVGGKRDSLENNPFDMVLHKTTEYIQKKDDPFEVTLEKALRLKCKKNMSVRTCSLDLTEDCDLKHKTRKEKLNKTFDEFLINDEINQNNASTNKAFNDSIVIDLNNANTLTDIMKTKNVVPDIDVQAVDLSILNQSVMNDILFETDIESSKDKTKSTSQSKLLGDMKKDSGNTEKIALVKASLEVPKLRRSLSQGGALSPKRSQYLNQTSLVESLRVNSDSGSNISSSNSLNILNEGFLRSRYSGNSVCSSISNISSIHRINSASSTNNSSLMLSNGTINRTFLESCSSEQSEYIRLSENIDLNKEIKPFFSVTKKSATSVAKTLTRSSMSDLTDRFNKLKAKTSVSMISESLTNNENILTCSPSNNTEECVTVMEKNEKSGVNNKLVDIDIFTPANNYTTEQGSSSISDTSSDSVFIEANKINKSILQEAKLLARTFEELALKTSSGSSIDDLITSNPLWASELLPAFEDEVSIENLIELPTSPDGSDAKYKSVIVTKCIDNNLHTEKEKEEYNNQIQDKIKELEMELVEPIHTEKRFTAATLLLDLRKLIETENNAEANKLLENLEKALGINCESNTELLAACLNIPNNLEKSLQKSGNALAVIKNVSENNMENSHENNLSNDSVDAININDVTLGKSTAKRKYLTDTCNKSKSETSELGIDTDKIKNEEMKKHNAEKLCKENSLWNGENNNLLDGKAVIELLANIGKLLSGQTEGNPIVPILKNLGNVLNFASNNVDKNEKSSSPHMEIQQTPKKSKLKFENNTHSAILLKSTNRLSLDLESKKQPPSKNFIRRSISVSQTPPLKNGSTSLMSSSKSTSQLKEVTKRFPSDPGFVSPTINKKAAINRKNVSQKGAETNSIVTFDVPKEKMSTINTVKNKFKRKLTRDVVNKKGPMKAMLPVGNMQKREAVSKKIPIPIDTVTPPKTQKFISSTPNSTTNGVVLKKSRSSKPVASSTPDAQSTKTRKIPTQTIASPKKRNFSCDISPVTTRIISVNNSGIAKSPRRNSKLQSPKKTTPKRRPVESGIPKSHTPPVAKRLNSSFDVNQYERMYESPQRSLYKTSNSQKNSPAAIKIHENNMQRSPFQENNKLNYKVKPINLISKLRRHSVGTIAMEKENNYV